MTDRYTLRAQLLREAESIITNDRNKSYGEPDEDFQRIAAIASAMGFRVDSGGGEIRELRGSDVARFMISLKLSRLAWNPGHRDSWMDIAGYAGCGYETAELEQARRDAAKLSDITDPLSVYAEDEEIKSAAQLAVSGKPFALEAMGWILTGMEGVEVCGATCSATEHAFHTGCQYRIRKRRKYV